MVIVSKHYSNLNLYTEKPRRIIRDTKSLRWEIIWPWNCNFSFDLLFFQIKTESNWTVNSRSDDVVAWSAAEAFWYCSLRTDLGFDVLVCCEHPSINRASCRRESRGRRCPRDLVDGQADPATQLLNLSLGSDSYGCMQIIRRFSQFLIALRHKFNGRIERIPLGLSKLFLHAWTWCRNSRCFAFYLKVFHDSATELNTESEQHFHHEAIKAPALVFFSDADQLGTEMQNRESSPRHTTPAWLLNAFGVHRMLDISRSTKATT